MTNPHDPSNTHQRSARVGMAWIVGLCAMSCIASSSVTPVAGFLPSFSSSPRDASRHHTLAFTHTHNNAVPTASRIPLLHHKTPFLSQLPSSSAASSAAAATQRTQLHSYACIQRSGQSSISTCLLARKNDDDAGGSDGDGENNLINTELGRRQADDEKNEVNESANDNTPREMTPFRDVSPSVSLRIAGALITSAFLIVALLNLQDGAGPYFAFENPAEYFDVDMYMSLKSILEPPADSYFGGDGYGNEIMELPALTPAEQLVGSIFGPPRR